MNRAAFTALASAALLAMSASAGICQSQSNALVPGTIAPYAPTAHSVSHGPSKATAPLVTPNGEYTPPTAPTSTTGSIGSDYDYVLGAGDKLRISVFGEENLSGEFYVAGNGGLSFPLIGEVPAAGKTLGEVRGEIVAALKDGYLKDPRVSAEVETFRPYYILGEVAKPGEYPYSDGITVMNAIATAGGFTYRANHRYVFVRRAHDTTEHRTLLTGALTLQPGDTVRILERYF